MDDAFMHHALHVLDAPEDEHRKAANFRHLVSTV